MATKTLMIVVVAAVLSQIPAMSQDVVRRDFPDKTSRTNCSDKVSASVTCGVDLHERLAASDIIGIATLVKDEAIGERMSDDEMMRRVREDRSGGTPFKYKGGTLYTLQIEPLCRGTDFLPETPTATPLEKEVHLFLPEGQRISELDGEQYEWYLPGRSYLVFLRQDPDKDKNVKEYKLDSTLSYYRAVNTTRRSLTSHRGSILLPKDQDRGKTGDMVTPFVAAVKSLCEAAQPTTVFGKLQKLEILRLSTIDPVVRTNAETAIKALGGTVQ